MSFGAVVSRTADAGTLRLGLGCVFGVYGSAGAYAVYQGAEMIPYVAETLSAIVALVVGVGGAVAYRETRTEVAKIQAGVLPEPAPAGLDLSTGQVAPP